MTAKKTNNNEDDDAIKRLEDKLHSLETLSNDRWRSEERRVGKESRSRWSPENARKSKRGGRVASRLIPRYSIARVHCTR